MSLKLTGGALAVILIGLFLQGCVFGGDGDGDGTGSAARPGTIVTATLPATMTDPILLGQSTTSGGGTSGTGGSSGQTYTVKSGDTLAAIAASLGVPGDQQAAWLAEVLRLNNIADARFLSAGQELLLPRIVTPTATRPSGTPGTAVATPNRTTTPGTPQPTTASGSATPRPTTPAGGSGKTYTVVSGDTPLVIAEKLGLPEAQRTAWANELLTLNNTSASALQIGQVLQLPAGTP